jgi:hypothetical protein
MNRELNTGLLRLLVKYSTGQADEENASSNLQPLSFLASCCYIAQQLQPKAIIQVYSLTINHQILLVKANSWANSENLTGYGQPTNRGPSEELLVRGKG